MRAGFKGVVWIAGVYFYFLIFAQFAFLEILAGRGFDASALKIVMACMAVGGIAGSGLVLPLRKLLAWSVLMRTAAGICALWPILAVAGQGGEFGVSAYAVVAFGTGLGLGVMTVLLAANLPKLMRHVYLGAGLGTGLAYMLSNLPWVFQSSSEWQCYLSAVAVMLLALLPVDSDGIPSEQGEPWKLRQFPVGLVWFTVLVWLDSAAFYIIQHNDVIKQGTWGESYLWRNAAIHLLVAILSGWLLLKGRIVGVLVSAFTCLGLAGLMASEDALRLMAGFLYPAGVSLYSVALIVYPAVWLGQKGATLRAVVLFAVAGWIGSAMGIGMAQDLSRVPWFFVFAAACAMALPLVWSVVVQRKREVVISAMVAVLCLAWSQVSETPPPTFSQVAKGRSVYISEGCIHCHSRYVRPETRDVLLWGPARDVGEITGEEPVVIGNRRQGPDLLMVGVRRSSGWLRQHFIDPRSLVPSSSMPGYAHLFSDDRGEALVAYLSQTQPSDVSRRWEAIVQWQAPPRVNPESAGAGGKLFHEHCAACHGEDGRGAGVLSSLWQKPPADLVAGPFAFSGGEDSWPVLARIIKFGIPGTDMPGHELLKEDEVTALADYVTKIRQKTTNPKTQ